MRRPDLLGRLALARSLPATIVVGAVGSGKTALLSTWFHDQDPECVVWLSADRGDADPVRFWRGLISAVQRLDPTFGVEASDIITLDGDVTADVLESLLVDEAVLDGRLSVVIDDAHLVSFDALEKLGRLIERRPVNLRFVIGSRTDPQIGLARLRLSGAVAEIRDTELRLGPSEIASMLERLGLAGADVDIDDLYERTEGWAAGVQLAALSVLGTSDASERLKAFTGTHTMIAEYLLDEVLANQPPHIHRFLEDTCILDELDASSCEALSVVESTGDEGGREGGGDRPTILLREVEAANLFLTRIDPAGTVFRYHQLFADLLRDQLRSRDPQRFREQHRRAAEHFSSLGDFVRSVNHMWKAGDRESAAHLIARNPLSVYLTTATPPPLDLLDYITDEDLLSDSSLVGGYALALIMNVRPREAGELIARVGRVVGFENLPASEWINLLSLQAGAQMLMGDTSTAVTSLSRVIDAIDRGETTSDQWIAVAVPVGVRAAAWEGNFDLAARTVAHYRPGNDPHLDDVDFVAAQALVQYFQGDVRAAITLATSATEAATELGVSGSGSDLAARSVLSAAFVDRGELDAAEPHIEIVLDSARVERVPSIVLATLARTRLQRARGEYDAAFVSLTLARSRFSDAPSTLSNYLDLAEFMVALALRDMDRAQHLMTRVLDPMMAGRMMGWFEMASGRMDSAADRVASIQRFAKTPRHHFELSVLEARIAYERQSPEFASRIARSFDLADETGLLLHIAEGGTGVLQAVRDEARQRVGSDTTERLALLQPLPRPIHRIQPHHPHDELSARELIVLRYMATAMSNQEIAAALFLSINTVKTHIKNVLRKTHAATRKEAVERARELNYL